MLYQIVGNVMTDLVEASSVLTKVIFRFSGRGLGVIWPWNRVNLATVKENGV
jgi:hypothetical protein